MKKLLSISLLLFLPLLVIKPKPVPLPSNIYCGPYTTSAKINLSGKSFRVIEKLSFDNNDADNFIHLTGCHDIVIRLCKFKNGKRKAIRLDGNCYNIRVDSNYFENTYGGLYVFQCNLGNISFQWNEGKNITGDIANINSFCQLNTCSGPNLTISYNTLEIAFGAGTNPNPGVGDLFNMYNSNGTSTSPIKCWYNQAIGGGTNVGSLGFAGILAGDLGGSWQDIRYNTLINTGYVGIQQVGGTHITITLNKIVGTYNVWSRAGITSSNAQPTPATNNEVSHNEIYWIAGYSGTSVIPMPGVHSDLLYKSANFNELPTGWATNIVWPASAYYFPTPPTNILPNPLVVPCSPPNISYTTPVTYTVGVPISLNSPTNIGGDITSFSISPALSSGLNFSTASGTISGTPTVSKTATNYQVIAFGAGGNDTTAVNITVNINAPHISYNPSSRIFIKGYNIGTVSPTNTGGGGTFGITPSLPSGLSFNTSNGNITGTPTVTHSAQNYMVTCSNSSGSSHTIINIQITGVYPRVKVIGVTAQPNRRPISP